MVVWPGKDFLLSTMMLLSILVLSITTTTITLKQNLYVNFNQTLHDLYQGIGTDMSQLCYCNVENVETQTLFLWKIACDWAQEQTLPFPVSC